jgi:HEPN domain-containing protein
LSPRSEEFMQQARDRLADAEAILGTAHPAVVVSAAYYGMLYAARAALSERGEFAKTHSGTWTQSPPSESRAERQTPRKMAPKHWSALASKYRYGDSNPGFWHEKPAS